MTLTPEEGHRLHVLTLLESRRISTAQAAEALGITPRQLRRLRAKLRLGGPNTLEHGGRGRPASNRLPASLRTQIVSLARGRYAGLNDVHLTEKLTAVEGLPVSRATVQRMLRAAGVVSPRHRSRPRRIVLLAAKGVPPSQIARTLSTTRPTVLLWRKRFAAGGLAALQKDAPGQGHRPSIPAATVHAIVAATTQTRPKGATHWSTRTVAHAYGVSNATVARIWQAHGL